MFGKELIFQENLLIFLALCACTILVAYLLTELFDRRSHSNRCPGKFIRPVYGYGIANGPHTWKEMFPASRGRKQSPVNIITREAVLVDSASPLSWTNYTKAPISIHVLNNGTTVVVQGSWGEAPPSIHGGPLGAPYHFQAALFRWGVSDAEGSEHTLNYMAFPLELQALHAHCDCPLSPPSSPSPALAPSFVAVSYFFEITELDNPFLDQVVTALPYLTFPGRAVELIQFPLSWLCPPFQDKFFSYDGSITFPPCTENVRWIINPTAIGISSRQVAAFRQLMGWDGPLHHNLRPVQPLFCRDIFYYADPYQTAPESENKSTITHLASMEHSSEPVPSTSCTSTSFVFRPGLRLI